MSAIDLLLLHQPSVNDFRHKTIMYGPISVSTVCDKGELFWRNHPLNFRWLGTLRTVLAFCYEETFSRWMKR